MDDLRLSGEFYSVLESLMLLLDGTYNLKQNPESSEQSISRELGKLHYIYNRDTKERKE